MTADDHKLPEQASAGSPQDAGDAPADQAPSRPLNRREALARLGLATGTAYAAPTLLALTEAKAQGGPPWSRPSRPTEPGEPGKKS